MKKKLFSRMTVLAVAVTMLVGCGGNDSGNATDNSGSGSVIESRTDNEAVEDVVSGETTVNEEADSAENVDEALTDTGALAEQDISEVTDVLQYIIDHEGKVPLGATKDNLKYSDISKLWVMVFEAIQNLDAEALKPYVTEENYNMCAEGFAKVKADQTASELWANTIGKLVYYPEAKVIVGVDIEAVLAMWYTDMAKNNAEMPVEDTDDLSVEQLMNIYNEYFVNAPYSFNRIMEPKVNIQEDGRIAVSVDTVIDNFYDESLKVILNPITRSHRDLPFDYYRVIMEREESLALGYDYIKDEFENFEALYAMDLDAFVTVTQGIEDKYKDGSFWKTFEKYYLDETNRAIMEKYLTESCLVYRDLGNLVVFIPASFNEFPGRTLKGEEKAAFEALGVPVYFKQRILAYPENFNNNFSAYATFADYAKAEGLVEK